MTAQPVASDTVDRNAVIVVTGSAALNAAVVARLPRGARIVAADGALDHAIAAGLRPDVLVGDLDSVTAAGLAWALANATVQTHPADKSSTDTELALAVAAALGPQRLILVAGAGDRLDHTIAALGALGSVAGAADAVEGWWGADQLLVATPGHGVSIDRPAGTTFSVLALHGACSGVTVDGARWPLDQADLGSVVGVGVSNEVTAPPTRIDVVHGVLTVIVPGAQP